MADTVATTPAPEPAFAAQHHDEDKPDETEPDVRFEAVVKLEPVEVKTLEEDETPIFKMRGKLFRFDRTATEWKERGIGNIRLMMHKTTGKVRVLMRRDKTLKICANHYITDAMKLQPNVDSDRSWVWNAVGDFSDGESKNEMLAIRFANSEFAQRFKTRFEECKQWNADLQSGAKKLDDPSKPQQDADAVEQVPEEGSEKKKKEDQEEEKSASKVDDAAANATAVVAPVEDAAHPTPAPEPSVNEEKSAHAELSAVEAAAVAAVAPSLAAETTSAAAVEETVVAAGEAAGQQVDSVPADSSSDAQPDTHTPSQSDN